MVFSRSASAACASHPKEKLTARAAHASKPVRTRWHLILGLVLAPVALAPDAAVAQLTNTPISITAQHSGKCLDVYGASVADGAAVIQWSCHGGANQKWSLRPYLDAYQVVASHSGKCLNVQGASTADGARAVQLPCVGANNELWYVSPRGSGYELVARHSAKCLAVNGGLATDGAQVVQWACDGSANQRWSIPAGVGSAGKWSGVINFPLVPVSAANLPDGKMLVWSAYGRFNFGGDNGRTYTAIFDPATLSATERLVTETGHDMFCPGISMLADGGVFVTGGSSSSKTSIYNPASGAWSAAAPMTIARGYQSSATLSNGGVFTVGGSWSGGQGNKDGEVWTSGTGWRRLSGVPDNPILGPDPRGIYRADNHAWLFGAGNGRVFHAGPSANMNWIDTNGSGSIVSAGSRGDDAYSMNGNAVMVDIGKILKIGGAPAYENANATNRAYVIDINAGVSVRNVAPMAYARAMHNSVVLPNGQVVIIGGQAYPVPFSDDRSVLAPELWDPASETFTTLAPMQVPRNYHSVALLLPDGRVFSAGGGLCGSCATNHANAQILTPPYLLNADGTPAARPSIVSAPASAAHGSSVTITTGSPVSSFALVRMGSVTHSVNTDQRRVPLGHISTGPNTYSVAIPSDPGVAIPGYYMLFALDGEVVPSIARIVRLGASPLPGSGTGLTGRYYNDPGTGAHFGTLVLTRRDATVNFNWGSGSPDTGVKIDDFSVRWTGQVQAPVTGNYTFSTVSDDGVRLWVNGQLVINNWTDHAPTTNTSAAIALTAGVKYAITMEFYERGGGATAQLRWAYPGQTQTVIPKSQLFP
jgi:galactose oxidase